MGPLFEEALSRALNELKGPTKLVEAMRYAVSNGGKRVRPKIVLLTGEVLGNVEATLPAALAVEYFHTASLIADDLPCMDNDDQRRGVPSLHCAFSQSTALLTSYALIAEGYEQIRIGAGKTLNISLAYTTKALGSEGLTGGQFSDLSDQISEEHSLLDVLNRKTGALFELSFLLGWFFGGGDLARTEEVQQMARSLGLVFQLEDDCKDLEEDVANGRLNAAHLLGVKRVEELIAQEKEKVLLLKQEKHLKEIEERVSLYFS
jgi:geranylgeranyl diphosphate synthase, type II